MASELEPIVGDWYTYRGKDFTVIDVDEDEGIVEIQYASGTVQQVYYRPGEMVPAGRPVLSILPPGNIKLRFFVAQALLPKIALGDAVDVACDGCGEPLRAKISFISRSAEYTPPVIYSLEERNKLVFMVEARPEKPDGLRVGQPVQVALKGAEAKK